MKKVSLKGVKETYYYEKLDNGLDVYLFPDRNTKDFYMTFSTKFGSLATEFKRKGDDKYHKVPKGVAHFLEHQMFETEDKNVFAAFDDLGGHANAYTSFDITVYEVMGNTNFYKNLNQLINYVQTPHLSEKGVEKEKGIICEEFKSGLDKASYEAMWGINGLIYHNDNHKDKIIGTIDDVKKTTLDDLKICYDYFYHPSNMQLIISGNFNIKKTFEFIKQNQSQKNYPIVEEVIIKTDNEPNEVVKAYDEKEMNIECPNLAIGYKVPISCFKDLNLKDYELVYYLILLFQANLGPTTELVQSLWDQQLILNGISFSYTITNSHIVILLRTKTMNPGVIKDKINEALKSLQINKEDYIRFKKVYLSSYIVSFDYVENKVDMLLNDIILIGRPFDEYYEYVKKDDYDIVCNLINHIDLSNQATYIIYPLKDQ